MSTERDLSGPITSSRFTALADAYGGDIRSWPSAEQDQAEHYLLEHGDHAQSVLEDAARLDDWLESGRIVPDPALYETIVASGLRQVSNPPRWAGLAAAVALVFGAGAGWFSVEPVPASDDTAYYADAFSVLMEGETSLFEETS